MRKWKIEDSSELYAINGWGNGYFDINQEGNVIVTPRKNGVSIDLKELVDELQLKDVSLPVLLRFPDILDDRIETISKCFETASNEYGFKGKYYTIYPIKVNQVRPVVEEIMRYGIKFNIGLEAALNRTSRCPCHYNNPEALIICNGYKDEDFIQLALLAPKMGKQIFML